MKRDSHLRWTTTNLQVATSTFLSVYPWYLFVKYQNNPLESLYPSLSNWCYLLVIKRWYHVSHQRQHVVVIINWLNIQWAKCSLGWFVVDHVVSLTFSHLSDTISWPPWSAGRRWQSPSPGRSSWGLAFQGARCSWACRRWRWRWPGQGQGQEQQEPGWREQQWEWWRVAWWMWQKRTLVGTNKDERRKTETPPRLYIYTASEPGLELNMNAWLLHVIPWSM